MNTLGQLLHLRNDVFGCCGIYDSKAKDYSSGKWNKLGVMFDLHSNDLILSLGEIKILNELHFDEKYLKCLYKNHICWINTGFIVF
jgi:hypothetical protein